jgi:hypothetical protein
MTRSQRGRHGERPVVGDDGVLRGEVYREDFVH